MATTDLTRPTYDIGDRPRFSGAFTEADGTPTAPTVVVVKVRNPAGQVTTYTSPTASIVLGATTVFTMPDPLDLAGTWTVNMRGTAGVQAADEREFVVRRSKF